MSVSRCLASVTSLRLFAGLATANPHSGIRVLRATYSSTVSSKRLLQTATHSTIPTEPPMPRGVGIETSITNPPSTKSATPPPPPSSASPSTSTSPSKTAPTRTKFRPRKSAMSLTPPAIEQLRNLMAQPDPKMIRVGVKNRGCSGLAYHLEYVDKPGKFDEEVSQEGVRVLIDSKALFSIIGSEMDWVEDKLSARFVFRNPNIKEQCGCGESFSVG